MPRLSTSFALAAWSGFLAVEGVEAAATASARGGGETALVALFLVATGLLVGKALVLILSNDAAKLRRGEPTAFAAIGLCAAMVVSAALFGAPFADVFARLDLAFWCIGLSLAAIAFDAAIDRPEDPEDEAAYRRSLLAVEASLRQARRERSEDGERP